MRRKRHAESTKRVVTFAVSEAMNTFGSQDQADLLLRPPSQIAGEPGECVWELRLRPDDFPFLLDHGVRGVAILPGAMHIELALTFFHAVRPSHGGRIFLQDVTFLHAIALQASLEVNLTLKLEANDRGEYLFTCKDADTATLCASLKICPQESNTEPLKRGDIPRTALTNEAASAFYAELQENGNEYGPCIQPVTRLYREPGRAWADVNTLDVPANRWGFNLHPVLLDGGFQTLAAAFDAQGLPYVLTGIDRIEISGGLSETDYWIDAEMASQNGPDDRAAVGQFTIYDREENAVIEASGVTLRYLAPSTPQRPAGLGRNIPIAISATFTAEPIEGPLAFWGEELGTPFDLQFAPYNQVFQQLLDPASVFGRNRNGGNVILFRFQDWHQGEGDLNLKAYQAQLDKKIEVTTLEFASALRSASAGSSAPFIVISCPPTPDSTGMHIGETSAAMEKLLAKELGDASNVHFVSGDELLSLYPVEDYFDPQSDRLGHVPYTTEFYCSLGTLAARKLDAVRRKPYKVIALDCDNTLWGGVCGEDGPHGLDLGGGWRQLQEFMVAQQERGMLLCLCSKNSEEDVFRVFEERSEMPLCREHLVEHRINWGSKSQNLISLADSLNLGLDSFIFVDDNPVECAEVRARCPEVLTLQLPSDQAQIPSYLEHVWAFDIAKITTEDKTRTKLYQENLKRERVRAKSLSLSDFLERLGLDIRISPPNDAQLTRVAQLTQRTNQFNITTIRRSVTEIRSLLIDGAMSCLVVEVSDRFGDYGLVGVILFASESDTLKVDTFLLSCRVLGRGVEHKVIAELGEVAVQRGCATVELPFVSTAKNVPALNFLRSLRPASRNSNGKMKTFSLPADAARAVTYNPDNVQSPGSVDESKPGMPGTAVNGAEYSAPVDYHHIAQSYPTAESILRAVQENRVRDSVIAGESFAEPANERERSIARIWEQVLGVSKVGAEQSFEELGGDSLKSVLLIVQLQKTLSVDLAITDIFEYTTVRAMAKMIDSAHDTSTVSRKNIAGQQRGSGTGRQAAVRAATGDDIDRIIALLIEGFPDMPPDQWRQIFEYKWLPEKPNLGFVLVDGSEIVGFVGTIYSVREINGRPESFCNGTSLYVSPAYRSYSMQLIHSFVSQPGHTITALTPNSTSVAIFKEMGFEALDRSTVIIPPLLQAHSLLRSVGVSVLSKPEEIKPRLIERDLKILLDHEACPCGHYLAVSKEETCYIVTRQGRVKRGIKVSEILYCSNRAMLRRHFEIIKLRILLTERALLLMGDERIFGRHCPAGLKRRGHRLFRSETLKATEIDNLYTEFVLLPV